MVLIELPELPELLACIQALLRLAVIVRRYLAPMTDDNMQPSEPLSREGIDRRENELLAAGAVWMVLESALRVPGFLAVEWVVVDGQATSEMLVSFDFLKSKYRIRVEQTDEPRSDGGPTGGPELGG